MCYYTSLKTSGGYCRTCIVKVTKGSEKDPRPMPKPVASCRTNVMDGMVVENTTNPDLLDARKGVIEFLLINHPLDCPICDQAGECHLQDLGYEHGEEASRYEFERRTFDPIDIGDTIKLHMTRCILCYRCVKVAEQTHRRPRARRDQPRRRERDQHLHQQGDRQRLQRQRDRRVPGGRAHRSHLPLRQPRVVHQSRWTRTATARTRSAAARWCSG